MKDEKGEPTRLALSAHAWGEPVPQTKGDATSEICNNNPSSTAWTAYSVYPA